MRPAQISSVEGDHTQLAKNQPLWQMDAQQRASGSQLLGLGDFGKHRFKIGLFDDAAHPGTLLRKRIKIGSW